MRNGIYPVQRLNNNNHNNNNVKIIYSCLYVGHPIVMYERQRRNENSHTERYFSCHSPSYLSVYCRRYSQLQSAIENKLKYNLRTTDDDDDNDDDDPRYLFLFGQLTIRSPSSPPPDPVRCTHSSYALCLITFDIDTTVV